MYPDPMELLRKCGGYLDIIYNQPNGYGNHDGAPYDDKQGFNLQIAKGAAFVGGLIKQGNQGQGYEDHQKFHAIVDGIQKDSLGTGIDCHEQFQSNEDGAAGQGYF